MKNRIIILILFVMVLINCQFVPSNAQKEGLKLIKAENMKFHMKFLSSDEFKGRNVPSTELKIASRYIALMAETIGLKPLMSDGSYYQELPLEISSISESASSISLTSQSNKKTFFFPQSFGVRGRSISPGQTSGEIVFLGLGIQAPDLDWNDFQGVDLEGKIVVFLDVQLPDNHILKPRENRNLFRGRSRMAREQGAAAVLSVISRDREQQFIEKGLEFDNPDRSRVLDENSVFQSSSSPALYQIDVRHSVAASILGIDLENLNQLFENLFNGERVKPREIKGKRIDVSVTLNTQKGATFNIVGYLEGTDPVLKEEYVLFGSHHDGIGYREDTVFNGADDNISGVVAMFSLAEAMMIERPKRSTVFVWHTGEEKGLHGAYYFVTHSPVPIEKISAEINMDMLCRNDPNSIYLIGSNKLSTELDTTIHKMNDKYSQLNLDYTYEDPDHPNRFFFRSDQYPYIRYGIPGVWFFSGTTEDYHQGTDTEEKVDYTKLVKVTQLVYLTAMDIGNKDNLLKLDINEQIKTRGKHNLEYAWRKP